MDARLARASVGRRLGALLVVSIGLAVLIPAPAWAYNDHSAQTGMLSASFKGNNKVAIHAGPLGGIIVLHQVFFPKDDGARRATRFTLKTKGQPKRHFAYDEMRNSWVEVNGKNQVVDVRYEANRNHTVQFTPNATFVLHFSKAPSRKRGDDGRTHEFTLERTDGTRTEVSHRPGGEWHVEGRGTTTIFSQKRTVQIQLNEPKLESVIPNSNSMARE